MSLESLADEIAAQAKAEAKAIVAAAKKEAKSIKKAAKAEVDDIAATLNNRAERESGQVAVEMVASSRQNNQKQALIDRRVVLDATWDEAKAQVGSAKLAGRADLIKALVGEAREQGEGMTLRPVSMDRAAIEKEAKGFDFGDDVEGLGGFVLESKDGSIVLDFRFDARLEAAWNASLGAVNETLFN